MNDDGDNKIVEACKVDICVFPDDEEWIEGVLTDVMNTLLDECVKTRNPNEVSEQVNYYVFV